MFIGGQPSAQFLEWADEKKIAPACGVFHAENDAQTVFLNPFIAREFLVAMVSWSVMLTPETSRCCKLNLLMVSADRKEDWRHLVPPVVPRLAESSNLRQRLLSVNSEEEGDLIFARTYKRPRQHVPRSFVCVSCIDEG